MGAVGDMLLAFGKRLSDGNPARFSLAIVRSATQATAKLSAFVMFILIGARIFSLTFYGVNGHLWVEHLLTGMPGGQLGFLILVNLLIFFLAFFLDFFELSFIVVPLLAPVAQKLGIDLIWFGVLLAVNMQTSFMHPPFGFALFYLRSVAPTNEYTDKLTKKRIQPVTTMQIYWGAVPFVLIQIIMVGLIIAFPGIVSSGLDKEVKIDLDKIGAQMQADMPSEEPAAPTPQPDGSAPAPATGAEPSAPAAPAAEDDPMKAMEESLSKEKKS
ncbi:MAG: TRAP transporter large permease subunit, partial [Variovorax sp.]